MKNEKLKTNKLKKSYKIKKDVYNLNGVKKGTENKVNSFFAQNI
jgi:hypothetical protein